MSLCTKYSPLLIPPYFLSCSVENVPGRASMWLSKLGLQKYLEVCWPRFMENKVQAATYAMLYRGG